MSALTDAARQNVGTKLCSVAQARNSIDASSDFDSAADFDAWMLSKPTSDGKRLTDIDMWNGLQNLGFRVGKQTLGRHRRGVGECGCEQ